MKAEGGGGEQWHRGRGVCVWIHGRVGVGQMKQKHSCRGCVRACVCLSVCRGRQGRRGWGGCWKQKSRCVCLVAGPAGGGGVGGVGEEAEASGPGMLLFLFAAGIGGRLRRTHPSTKHKQRTPVPDTAVPLFSAIPQRRG